MIWYLKCKISSAFCIIAIPLTFKWEGLMIRIAEIEKYIVHADRTIKKTGFHGLLLLRKVFNKMFLIAAFIVN